MANPQHIEWLKEGRDAWNARRERDDFVPDFQELPLFSNPLPKNLKGFDFRGANLENSGFFACDFTGTDFSGANLKLCYFQSCYLSRARMRYSNLDLATFKGSLLYKSDFRNASLNGTRIPSTQLNSMDVRDADLSQTKGLRVDYFYKMRGNSGTKLPARLPFPDEWRDDYEAPDDKTTESALDTPAVRSAPVDFDIVDTGVEAHLPADHSAAKSSYSRDGQNRASALIDNARAIAGAVSNKLGEDTRTDLLAYATHLEVVDPANPHRLSFIAKGIAADLGDDLVAAGYSNRLKAQLQDFLDQHQRFLEEVIPAAAEAIATRDNIKPARDFTSEDATEIIDTMDQAIAQAEAATQSVTEMIQGLRDHDAELQAMKLKAFSRDEIERFDKLLERVTVENATIVSRLYFRAKEALEKVRENGVTKARKHAGDMAIAGTLSGKSAPEMAQAIVNYLQPLMEKLAQILTVLPPL